jgi:hypothetical protein
MSPFDRRVVEAEVEDGVHHAGHRRAGAGADGEEQGIVRIAELRAHVALDLAQGLRTWSASTAGYVRLLA